MEDEKKSKRVSWATEANLRQEKIFRSGDCPSEIGLEAPDDPQPKASNSNVAVSDGFLTLPMCPSKGKNYVNPMTDKVIPCISLIPWRTPPKLDLNSKWHVAAGEESQELKVQMHRSMRELDAIYPHSSAFSPSPSISSDMEDEYVDDNKTRIIPIDCIEDTEELDFPSDETAALNISFNSQLPKLPQSSSTSEILDVAGRQLLPSPGPSHNENFDLAAFQDLGDPLVAAATAAATAILNCKEPGSLIDPELLVKLLSNPKMTEKLMNEWSSSSSTTAGTSGMKEIELPLPQPNFKPSFLINKSALSNSIPAKSGVESWPLMVEQSSAAAAATAILNCKEPGSLIDPELLVKLLSNPKMTEKLMNEWSSSSSTTAGTSGMKEIEQPLPQPNFKPSFLINKSVLSNSIPAKSGVESGPLMVEQSSAAATAILNCKEPGSLIDPELLVKLLSNPKMTEKLMNEWSSSSSTTAGTSGMKEIEQPLPLPNFKPSFLIYKSALSNAIPAKSGVEPRPLMVEQSSAALSETVANTATTGTGIACGRKPIQQSTHSLNSTVSLVQKYTSENIQQANAGHDALPRSVDARRDALTRSVYQPLAASGKIRTCLGSKPVSISDPLLSSTSDFLSEKSFSEHFQTADTGFASVVTSSVTLSSSNPDFSRGKSAGKRIQLADTGNVTVPMPVKLATSTDTSAGSRSKTVTSLVPLMSSTPDNPSEKFMNEHSQLANSRHLSALKTVKPSVDATFRAGMGFGPKQVTSSVSLPGSMPNLSWNPIREHGPPLNTALTGPTTEKQLYSLPSMQTEWMVNLPGAEHQLFPSATPLSSMVEPLRVKFQSTALLPTEFRASSFSSTRTSAPSPKDANYLRSLIKQHGEEKDNRDAELYQYGKPHQYLQAKKSDSKYRKPCMFYNSSKGCRNGSRCPYQHDMQKQRSDVKLDAPGSKRKKLGPCMFYDSSKGCRNGSRCPYQHDMQQRKSAGESDAPASKRVKLDGNSHGGH